ARVRGRGRDLAGRLVLALHLRGRSGVLASLARAHAHEPAGSRARAGSLPRPSARRAGQSATPAHRSVPDLDGRSAAVDTAYLVPDPGAARTRHHRTGAERLAHTAALSRSESRER